MVPIVTIEGHDLQPLLAPRSAAVVGASPRGNRGTVILRNMMKFGYSGALHAINPKHAQVEGVSCAPSLGALAEVPEFVAIALPAAASVGALREAAGLGVRAALLIAGGFSEGSGEGVGLQAEIQSIARQTGIKVCGPNCYGIANIGASFAPYSGGIVEPLKRGHVAYVLQSGAVTHALHDTLIGRGPGISTIVTSGNEAVVELAEYVDYLIDDPQTHVIALFIEGLRNPVRFAKVASKALAAGKPIVALKVGRTERGQRATLAHTGSVAGVDEAYEGLFRRHGVVRVDDIDDMRETLVLLSSPRRPKGRGAAIASISGGLTTMLTDLSAQYGLETPQPSTVTQARLKQALPDFGTAMNPLDTTGALAEDATILAKVADAFLADDAVATFAFALNTPLGTKADLARAHILARAQQESDKPIVAFSVAGGAASHEMAQILGAGGIPFLTGARQTVAALRRWIWLEERRNALTAPAGRMGAGRGATHPVMQRKVLAEHEATQALSVYGVPFVRQARATTGKDAAEAAAMMGFPVAVKIDSPDILHKTEAGGVALALRDAQAVEEAFARVVARARALAPDARLDGVLVQRMAPRGLEVLLGVTRHGDFGLQLAVGLGGIFVEAMNQVSLRGLPISEADAHDMLDETALGGLLEGFRGMIFDRAALIDAMLAVASYAADNEGCLMELDINPLIILPRGQGVMAVDAMVVLEPP